MKKTITQIEPVVYTSLKSFNFLGFIKREVFSVIEETTPFFFWKYQLYKNLDNKISPKIRTKLEQIDAEITPSLIYFLTISTI